MTHNLWYIRRGDETRGPFPAGQISRYLLLGRLEDDDLVSPDGEQWAPLGEHPELVPEVLKADLDDPENRRRLEAARRWEDERGMGPEDDLEWTGPERRHGESLEAEFQHQLHHETFRHEARPRGRWRIVAAGAAVLVVVILAMRFTPEGPAGEPMCGAAPAAGVNWNNCPLEGLEAPQADLYEASIKNADLRGADLNGADLVRADLAYTNLSTADLSGADLRGARLTGAGLRNARLDGATLAEADLAYADLTGARIDNADLTGAKLANAIWIDGRKCGPGSRGVCVPVDGG